MSNYIPTIGVEVHCELKTNTKIFSNSVNGYGQMANSLTNVIDLGYPGTLPTLNKEVINLAIKAALILNCKIRPKMHFDRKNYFYPDNPKNYQITQAETPIGYDGYVEIDIDGKKKKIEIEEMHIEEDTCKSTHRGTKTLLDFNRAGVPLIEIVTKPCMESGEEAKLYLEKLKELLFYSDVSDCKMEEGSMRADANVSIRKSISDPYGTKAEIKNIGSISNVKLSIEKEIERQAKLYDNGETFLPQTRRFDDKLNDTVLMRVKETGNDYRYFPEPDIPYVYITEKQIEEVRKTIPMLPDKRREKYQSLGISEVNAKKLVQNRALSDYLNELLDEKLDFKTASNLLLGDISGYLNKNEEEITNTHLTKEKFIELTNNISDGTLTSKNVKEILDTVMESDKNIKEIIKEKGIQNITDGSAITEMIKKIIAENPDSVADYKAGKDRAIKYLMGQVMKESKGALNPKMAMDILQEELNK
ncbi:MAG: Asp-tRNA(Asn)/Glu-tRNA(Gln) amidotransferase subunit GatB [Candidatus Faecimonas sp.]|nr:Asp-tRNA(Asn)/Glu-tRNA(Gln) amidotransferase subunit GatB [Mycoplasmatota bacterium]MDY2908566.1 Asp-tRNA(Asn)/Glu-tRNA(Gln) amidotransferase subunit GatB [Candidatus Faecimonas sp.]